MQSIADIRAQYPDYKDLSDAQLADALHTKFYSDMPRDQFNSAIGLGPTARNTDTVNGDPYATSMPYHPYTPVMQRPLPTADQLGEAAGRLGSAAKGAGVSLLSLFPTAIAGDVEALGRAGLRAVGADVSPQTKFKTSSQLEDAVAGKPSNEFDAGGRELGGLAAPFLLGGAGELVKAATGAIPASLPADVRAQLLLSRALTRDKISPANAADTIAQFGDKPTAVMDVGGNNTARLARTVNTLPGEGSQAVSGFLAERQADQGGRVLEDITDHLANGTDVQGVTDKLTESRAKAAAPLYEQAFAGNQNISSPSITQVLMTPAGKKALADASVMMQNDLAPMGGSAAPAAIPKGTLESAAGDVAFARQALPPDPTLLQVIRSKGGINILDHKGNLTSEGSDIQSMLDKNSALYRSVVNNQAGSDLDTIRESLNEDGWFGGSPRGDTTINDLLELIGREGAGEKIYHPTSNAQQIIDAKSGLNDEMRLAGVDSSDASAAQTQKLAAFRAMKDKANALGVSYDPYTDAETLRKTLFNAAPKTFSTASGYNLKTLDYVKQSLDDQISAAIRAGEKNRARSLTGLNKQLRDALDQADTTGTYAKARAAYSGPTQSLDALQQGQDFLKLSPDALKQALSDLKGSDQDFFRTGAARALQDRVNGAPDGADVVKRVFGNKRIRAQIGAVFGNDAADKFAQAMTPEKVATATNRFVTGGSNTANKLADVEDAGTGAQIAQDAATGFMHGGPVGAILHPIKNQAVGRIGAFFKGLSPEVRAQLGNLLTLTGPDAQSKLLALANSAQKARTGGNAGVLSSPSIMNSPMLRTLLMQRVLSQATAGQPQQ